MNKLDTWIGRREKASVPAAGILIRQEALGSEATYRIMGKTDQGVEVEVVDAPGLEPRARFTFATADVIKMTDSESGQADHTRRAKRAIRIGLPKRHYA